MAIMSAFQFHPLPSPISPTEKYFDLGTHSSTISTKSQDAQIWFDRGLIWSYAFNNEEGYCCFEQALAHDPDCAMAYWGLTYATGPNYNKSWQLFDPTDLEHSFKACYYASRKAEELADKENTRPVERALIKAIQFRFPVNRPVSDISALNCCSHHVHSCIDIHKTLSPTKLGFRGRVLSSFTLESAPCPHIFILLFFCP